MASALACLLRGVRGQGISAGGAGGFGDGPAAGHRLELLLAHASGRLVPMADDAARQRRQGVNGEPRRCRVEGVVAKS